jgi:hypothetical protein
MTFRPAVDVSIYAELPACVDRGNHRFTISAYHPDRAVCERCGLIRKAEDK